MNKKLSNKQRGIFFWMNVSAFAVIFILLGIIILQVLNQNAYRETDQTLKDMSKNPEMIQQEVYRYQQGDVEFTGILPKEPPRSPSSNRFNTQIILWSGDGEILNKEALGGRYSELKTLRLKTDELETIQTISLQGDEKLIFHSLTKTYQDGDIAYVQIVSNVNQIQHSLRNFRSIVIGCMIIFWLLSIGVSYWLSAISMKPILKAWQKQQEFVENASHELRTPLTIIQNRLEGLFRKPNQTIIEESESIAQALNETRRLTGLTADLLTIARSDANQLTLDKEPRDTKGFLTTVTAPFREMAEIEGKDFRLTVANDLQASFDQQKLHQVFVILLDNALKYTQKGEAILVHSMKTHKMWEVHVINTGPTISQDGKKHLFERFYREDQSRSKETGGYGLGLAIAKQIVEEHQGQIILQDYSPRGADFCVKIPLK
ncbi:HAMP domain-containing histidine kinase [Enterococcus saccharolyticus]|uniref:sensor histidine kinase n=1 Tax=Enterococcus TaxID=1350 RepID=UPI001E5AD774|nr:HAMP domain-containing sensor histidine kinase [Enterococcus saccharolyticus]MCD5003536.1 HAMP domain-containing histidine kinase [Enterococcus saccharolyticus]